MMKKWFCVYASAALAALICAAAVIFLRGWIRMALCLAAAAVWVVLFVRFCLIRYEFSDSEIKISGGLLFKYRKTIKREALISVSRLFVGDKLICTIIRTAGDFAVLFCKLTDD